MERSIALCNGISQWVQLMVLSRPTPQLRAEVFIKFIHVAQVSDWMETFILGHEPSLSYVPSDPQWALLSPAFSPKSNVEGHMGHLEIRTQLFDVFQDTLYFYKSSHMGNSQLQWSQTSLSCLRPWIEALPEGILNS